MPEPNEHLLSPVTEIDARSEHPGVEKGIALCLSGGGYRAMLFHLGSLWRLYEAGILKSVKRISSVSGGSITAGVLALNWKRLSLEPARIREDFVPLVVRPIRELGGRTLDRPAIIGGALLPGSIGDKIADSYNKYLFDGATLQDLPDDPPRFVFNATNVQSGALWRFMKPYMRDYRVGEVKRPRMELARAVAASSAFPPVLSPVTLELQEKDFTPNTGLDLQKPPYTTEVILSDGGVYDNLGLETAWKRYHTILVSDAGGKTGAEPEPKHDWGRHAVRVMNLIDNQVRSLRKRQLIGSYIRGDREGTYWGIRSNVADYPKASPLPCPFERTIRLADLPTRLKRLDDDEQERLINWGYAVCDVALRAHVDAALPPGQFPYPKAKV